ncbi:hypothetical protein C9J12_15325 [Photobacterium frigidiphilum]|uniref:CobQ/CobB/MinD/ParA nucleotide binding domain-containing protein n=1 Tax=Photobacterium frigidiphilum TaxID=264736 RepID=A0A2T3JEM3_9GAMM|nr:hypothetical protein [Photobacterium frigidiphilum]PSU47367.1 hypothetical protein C9J12_15325 [Photobacterium frigidiphilum]
MQLTTQALMVQGTTSDAGKSVLTAGLCRVLACQWSLMLPYAEHLEMFTISPWEIKLYQLFNDQ